ncbi:replicative DNA helicase [Bacteroidota bacterium]
MSDLYNLMAEKQVLGSILVKPNILSDIQELLYPMHFYDKQNQVIYKAILDLDSEGIEIDPLTVFERLTKNKEIEFLDSKAYLSNLPNEIFTTEGIGAHSRLIVEKYMQRKLIELSKSVIERTKSGQHDIFELMEETENELQSISNEVESSMGDERPLSDRLDEVIDDIELRRTDNSNEKVLKLTTLPSLNDYIGGIMPGDLIGIYGKEKSTKSTLAHEIALDLAEHGNPVAIFSLEVSRDELEWKSISMRSGIEFNKLRNPKGYSESSNLSDKDMAVIREESNKKLSKSEIYICDRILNEFQIQSKLKNWKNKYGIRLVIIDYLLLLQSSKRFNIRREELNYFTMFFKRLAMKLQIPIILISQANHEGERVAEAKGLERDSNYFIYVEIGEEGKGITFHDNHLGTYKHTIGRDEYIVTVRGIRHGRGNRTLITKFSDNRYVEVDSRKRNEAESYCNMLYNLDHPADENLIEGAKSLCQEEN